MDAARIKILSLDGGGAKGFYTLGVLREVEAMMGGGPLSDHFRLIFGTSTGSILAALLALGYKVNEIYELYRDNVPLVTKAKTRTQKSQALAALSDQVFGDKKFDGVKTGIGIVATKWMIERPMIFKANVDQAHGRKATFVPGFGCTIGDAVQASCSAYPFFHRKIVVTAAGDRVELVDGGYCANNPTLYAIADAVGPLAAPRANIRILSIGVGTYPTPAPPTGMATRIPASVRGAGRKIRGLRYAARVVMLAALCPGALPNGRITSCVPSLHLLKAESGTHSPFGALRKSDSYRVHLPCIHRRQTGEF